MTYTGLELFMEKLKQIIFCNGNPLINKTFCEKKNKKQHPLIECQRRQIKLLYEELGSMIQTMFVNEESDLHDLEEVRNLKKKFKDVAQEAHDLVDQFVSDIIFIRLPGRYHIFEVSLNLEDVMRSLKSIAKDFSKVVHIMKLNSSPRTKYVESSTKKSSLESKKIWDEIVVGLDHDVELIRDKLVEDQRKLDVVSIVGMGGIGKTTLATKVFNDRFVENHFQVRAWVTVSQTYEKRDFLIQILKFIDVQLDLVSASDSRLCELLHKRLMRKRYLIVIDDIWSNQDWDELKVFFPNDHTGSRILLTSCLNEVALHANSDGLIHRVSHLTDDKSWELLRKKVFNGDQCPNWLIGTGMRIARNCHGLPLALVVIAGVLAKEEVSKDSWKRIARSVSSYIVNDTNWYIESLVLSINRLPSHLRDCFLYLGGFPEDYLFQTTRLIWLWVAEGFIQEDGNQSLEETAENYLIELVDRNLVVVKTRKFSGAIKTCYVHDILRELCMKIATNERFCLTIPSKPQIFDPFMVAQNKKRRIFANRDMGIINAPNIRSFLSFYKYPASMLSTSYFVIKFVHSWLLLMVLDLQSTKMDYITAEISLLVHLRYLAILLDGDFPSTICNLWSLQTLILRCYKPLVLPKNISNLVNLRHLWCSRDIFLFFPIQRPLNLQTISKVVLRNEYTSWVKYFPGIKKLSSTFHTHISCKFESLIFLETLKIACSGFSTLENKSISFPASLKKLTLSKCHLPWRDMSKIQALPKLMELVLLDSAFVGSVWDAGEEPFQQLQFLKLKRLNIQHWEASRINFPRLKQLVLDECRHLDEIPTEIGYIPTLEHIEISGVRSESSVVESVNRIQEEQHADGNSNLNIKVNTRNYPYWTSFLALYFEEYPLFEYEIRDEINTADVLLDRPPVFPARYYPSSNRKLDVRRPKYRLAKRKF